MINLKSKTEKLLVATIGVLFIALVASVFSSGSMRSDSASAESEANKSEEKSSEEPSVKSTDEPSEPSVKSTPSVKNTTSVKSTGELSVKSTDETSVKSESAEASETEKSALSVKSIEGFDEVVSVDGDVAIVKKGEKLFFFIPVEIESEITLDEQGNVISERQSFWSRLLSILSF